MVPAAVDLSVLVEIDEIDQQLAAGDALETLRVPTAAGARSAGEHGHVAAADLPAALEKRTWSEGRRLDGKSERLLVLPLLWWVLRFHPWLSRGNLPHSVFHLLADRSRHGDREESDGASAQVFPFPLLTEQTQLLLLLLIQRVTVLGLQKTYLWKICSGMCRQI